MSLLVLNVMHDVFNYAKSADNVSQMRNNETENLRHENGRDAVPVQEV
jgi:hypothetical protein